MVVWSAPSEIEEAGWVANLILDLVDAGVRYRDVAVLVRSRAAYARLVEQFGTFDIPVQPGGRSGLFDHAEAVVLGHTITWLTDTEWRDRYGPSRAISDDDPLDEYQRVFELPDPARNRLARFLRQWKTAVPLSDRTADLVGELYDLLDELAVCSWDLNTPQGINRLGTLARFSSLLADYESVRRRARPDPDIEGEQVGGEDRGTWYYRNLALHIINYALYWLHYPRRARTGCATIQKNGIGPGVCPRGGTPPASSAGTPIPYWTAGTPTKVSSFSTRT